jgi:hypothetical protein
LLDLLGQLFSNKNQNRVVTVVDQARIIRPLIPTLHEFRSANRPNVGCTRLSLVVESHVGIDAPEGEHLASAKDGRTDLALANGLIEHGLAPQQHLGKHLIESP